MTNVTISYNLEATSNKCLTSSNKCLTSSNKKLLVTSATLLDLTLRDRQVILLSAAVSTS